MRCRYCHYQIQWFEGQGWLRMSLGLPIYGTTNCPERFNPERGHALPEPAII